MERQRSIEKRLEQRHDAVMTLGVELGTRYVDPKNPKGTRKGDEPYTSLEPYIKDTEALERLARPWLVRDETPEEREARLDREQDEAFRRAFGVMQA